MKEEIVTAADELEYVRDLISDFDLCSTNSIGELIGALEQEADEDE